MICTAIIGPYEVYLDRFHVTATYATYLQHVLAQALFSATPTPTHFEVVADDQGRETDRWRHVSGSYLARREHKLG